jgi:NAD(P)-dependent dehydrogenase (short-subunit alcohol dehydrogenase family)
LSPRRIDLVEVERKRQKWTMHVLLCRINNAGSNAYRYGPLAESVDDELVEIVSTNVLGVMLCCREVRGWVTDSTA